MIRFLLDGQVHTLNDVDPNTTVLDYLRLTLGKTGTKEGCASGDCGACTVVLAELNPNNHESTPPLIYTTINSCLTLLPALDGKQLITVENLKHNEQLHPVQQAMVDEHGSQCGFCTPGIVMSLFAHYKNAATDTPYNRHATELALGGNLCRCTGYQPIFNAAKALSTLSNTDQFSRNSARTAEDLLSIKPTEQHSLSDGTHRAFSPTSTEQLCELLNLYPEANLLAGGTDLSLSITQFHEALSTIIYVGSIAELQHIRWANGTLVIGAAATLSNSANALKQHLPDFAELLNRFASLQIRNQGTLGGNIANASPIGDSPPALIAADASLTLRSASGSRTVNLEDFFVDYKVTALASGEYIESIHIPPQPPQAIYKIFKISKRLDDDISAVLGAFRIVCNSQNVIVDCRLAFGGMAATPKRAQITEAFLLGKEWNEANVLAAKDLLLDDFTPLSDFRASAQYRLLIAQNLLEKCWIESTHSTDQTVASTRITDASLLAPYDLAIDVGTTASAQGDAS